MKPRPRLTKAVVDALEDVSNFAGADAEGMNEDGEEGEQKRRILRGCRYIDELSAWYRGRQGERR